MKKLHTYHVRIQHSKLNRGAGLVLIVQVFANAMNVGILVHLLRGKQAEVDMASTNNSSKRCQYKQCKLRVSKVL